jgi:hypothetical protein
MSEYIEKSPRLWEFVMEGRDGDCNEPVGGYYGRGMG